MPSPTSAPLAENYPTKVLLVILALCPYIVVTTAATLMQDPLLKDLHTSKLALQMTSGLANAGYAFGAVLAAVLVKRLPPRPLLLGYEALFVAGSVMVAGAPSVGLWSTGRVVQGAATGLMLVAALPPLVTAFPAARLPVTAAVVDIGLFGATTVGPLVGGAAGAHDSWRLVFWILAGAGALGWLVAFLSVDHADPLDPGKPIDLTALVLAAAGTVLPFFAASELTSQPVVSWLVLPALVVGVAALVALLVVEYRKDGAATPVRLVAHSFPVTGILIAMCAGAAAVALLELAEEFLVEGDHTKVMAVGWLFWPQVAAVVVAAVAFGAVLKTRHMTTLIVVGTIVLGAGAVGIGMASHRTGHTTMLLVAAAIGFGAGATVSPGLFLAALSCPSDQLGPTFALVELLRSAAAFLVGPILLHVSLAQGAERAALDHGISVGGWSVLVILGAGLAVCAALWRASGAHSQRPDLEAWLEDGDEALDSPPLLQEVR